MSSIGEIRAERDAFLVVIAGYRKQGLSAQEIGVLLGRTTSSIKTLCTRYKIPYTPKSESKKEAIARLLREGKQNQEIMETLGVGKDTVISARKKLGLVKTRCHPREQEMWAMHLAGVSGYQISKDLGVPRMTVSDALKRLNSCEERREPLS